jgi:hypothetical protein
MTYKISRREFIQAGATATVGLTVVPSSVLGKVTGRPAPSDKLNIAGVGVGGRGFAVLKHMESQNIVGLTDVDWKYSKPVFDYFSNAKKYYDYREMYDELGKSIDAVMVATSDHTHAIIARGRYYNGKTCVRGKTSDPQRVRVSVVNQIGRKVSGSDPNG